MNEHIENYCIEYIESELNPQFAILLKGEWGCGKTFFINNLISRYNTEGKKLRSNDIIYISLFGVSNITEIDDKLFQKIHPILSSKHFNIATGLFRSIIKSGINYSSGGILNLENLDISSEKKIESKQLEKKLFIIDDIERTNLNPIEIFGYFSEYLCQLNMKVIFIGNEDQISEIDNKKSDYHKIKEKTIGVEFTLKPETEKALNCFIKEFLFKNDSKSIRNNCMEAISILNCNNLRIVRQCLYNIKLFLKTISKIINKNDKIILLRIFINLFIQKSMNNISEENQIRDAIVGFDMYKKNYKDYKKYREENNMIFDHYREYIPLESILANIIFNGDYSKENIKLVYQQEKKERTIVKQKNLFILIGDWRSMNQDIFKTIINTVNTEFETGFYLHPGEILHYINIMVIFCEWGLINRTRSTLINKTKEIINKYKEKITPVDDWAMLGFSYAGWAYNNEIEEIKEIREYLKNISNENLYKSIKINLKNEIENIHNDIRAFNKNIIHVNGNGKYYGKPFLSLLNINDFYSKLISLPIEDQSLIISAFEERYGIIYSNGEISKEYKEDKENLIKLSNLYDSSLGSIEYNPQELLKKDISVKLHNLIDYFEKQFTSTNNP